MISRWSDPFRDLEKFQSQMNRLFNDSFNAYGQGQQKEGIAVAWAPPVDICESADNLCFTVEVPGFKESELTLRAENNILTIEGERRFEDEKKDKNFHRVERSYGRFMRSFTLPVNISTENVKASLNDGVLTIELPKREETKPKSIPIGAGAARQIRSEQPQGRTQTAREAAHTEQPELVGAGTSRR